MAGGREPPQWEAYPHHQFLHRAGALQCCDNGGCWKSRVVPLGDGDEKDAPENCCVDVVGTLPRCMDLIAAEDVIRAIEVYFAGGAIDYLTAGEANRVREVLGSIRFPASVAMDCPSRCSPSTSTIQSKHWEIEVLRSPIASPKANSLCERVIGTARRECLDWLIPPSEAHLRAILKCWVTHYNRGRPHSALGPGVPDPSGEPGSYPEARNSPSLGVGCARHREIDPRWLTPRVFARTRTSLIEYLRIGGAWYPPRSGRFSRPCRCPDHRWPSSGIRIGLRDLPVGRCP